MLTLGLQRVDQFNSIKCYEVHCYSATNTITGDVNTSLMIYSVSTSLTASNAMKFTAIQQLIPSQVMLTLV